MLEISPAEPSQTPGHGTSNIDLLWCCASSGLDELSQASQCKPAYLLCQLHDTLEGNTAILLPALQIQNPLKHHGIRPSLLKHVSSVSYQGTYANAKIY